MRIYAEEPSKAQGRGFLMTGFSNRSYGNLRLPWETSVLSSHSGCVRHHASPQRASSPWHSSLGCAGGRLALHWPAGRKRRGAQKSHRDVPCDEQ